MHTAPANGPLGSGAGSPGFRILGVFGKSAGTFWRNLGICGLPPLFLLAYFQLFALVLQFVGGNQLISRGIIAVVIILGVPLVVGWFVYFVFLTAQLYFLFHDLAGTPVPFRDLLKRIWAAGMKATLTLFCTAFLAGFGLVLLVVPGIAAALAFCVALPACLIEDTGGAESLKRSLILTRGHRFKILGIGAMQLFILASGLTSLAALINPEAAAGESASLAPVAPALFFIYLWLSFSAAVLSAIYYELRAARGELK